MPVVLSARSVVAAILVAEIEYRTSALYWGSGLMRIPRELVPAIAPISSLSLTEGVLQMMQSKVLFRASFSALPMLRTQKNGRSARNLHLFFSPSESMIKYEIESCKLVSLLFIILKNRNCRENTLNSGVEKLALIRINLKKKAVCCEVRQNHFADDEPLM